jgi:hypothetical protein
VFPPVFELPVWADWGQRPRLWCVCVVKQILRDAEHVCCKYGLKVEVQGTTFVVRGTSLRTRVQNREAVYQFGRNQSLEKRCPQPQARATGII